VTVGTPDHIPHAAGKVIYNPALTRLFDAHHLYFIPYHPSSQPYEPSSQISRIILASSGYRLPFNLPTRDCLHAASRRTSGIHSLTGRISRICMCKRHSPAVWAEVRCAFAWFLNSHLLFPLLFPEQCQSLFLHVSLLPQCLTFLQALQTYRETLPIIFRFERILYTVAVAHPRV
jgi:hypothetical protein